jgi:hypothetical protein
MEKMRWDRAKGETGPPSHGFQRENKHKYRAVPFYRQAQIRPNRLVKGACSDR